MLFTCVLHRVLKGLKQIIFYAKILEFVDYILGGYRMELYFRSIMFGLGLAMDACAVSMANGLKEPQMRLRKIFFIALIFAFFQLAMPLIGYFVGHAFIHYIESFIPWIALILLTIIGSKMIYEGITSKQEDLEIKTIGLKFLLIQAVATSIDALSVGFTIADYSLQDAIITVALIGVVTFFICVAGVFIGKKFGAKLGNRAEIIGGIILVAIGLEIFISNIFF